jgi:hypothetical protein
VNVERIFCHSLRCPEPEFNESKHNSVIFYFSIKFHVAVEKLKGFFF